VYSESTTDHFLNPRNIGPLENADAVGTAGTPGEGNFMVIELKLRGGSIGTARFQTYGCPAAVAAGSCLTEWIMGMAISEAGSITGEALEVRLGGLPLGKGHCAALAVEALRAAVSAIGHPDSTDVCADSDRGGGT
jgi:nitrogen fixation NifU-like protein